MQSPIQILKAHKEDLFKKYPIASLAIFGSRARNDYREDSDIDIMVELKEPDGMKFIYLTYELEELLKVKVDLVSKGGIKKEYFKAIEGDLKYV